MRTHGYTLLELLITLLIVSLLLSIAIPGFTQQIQSNRTRTATLELLESINHARTLAVTHGKRATIRNRGQWAQGWEIFIDENNNGLWDEGELLLQERTTSNNMNISGNRSVEEYVSFIPSGESRRAGRANGGSFQAGTFTICPTEPGAGYELVLARSGRLRMDTISKEECGAA